MVFCYNILIFFIDVGSNILSLETDSQFKKKKRVIF